jgi:DNA-binding transcriptional LysR family regulator
VELRQLEHFVAAAEERHFTRAARRLHIVQSGLSASIRVLERELGAPLFIRSTRRVELTQAGLALLPEARRTLAAAAAAGEAVAAVQGLLRGTLAVGTMQILPPAVDLLAVLGRFHAEHPGVELRLRQAGTGTLLQEVAGGALDLALVAVAGDPPKGLVVRRLASEPLLAACAPGHPLAGRDEVDLTELAGEPFVDFQQDWGLRMLVDQQLAAAGRDRRVALEINDVPPSWSWSPTAWAWPSPLGLGTSLGREDAGRTVTLAFLVADLVALVGSGRMAGQPRSRPCTMPPCHRGPHGS